MNLESLLMLILKCQIAKDILLAKNFPLFFSLFLNILYFICHNFSQMPLLLSDVAIGSKTNAQISSISQKRRLEKQSALEINNSKCYFCLFCLVTLIQWSKSTFETRKLINSYIPWLLILSAKGPTSINTAICRWLRFIHFELQTSIHDCCSKIAKRKRNQCHIHKSLIK